MSNKNNPKFTINNFRIFDKPQTFELAPITILTGPNNSGKSSLVKALLMLKNDRNGEEIPFQINLPNRTLDLPNAKDLLNKVDESFEFKFMYEEYETKFIVNLGFKRNYDSNLKFYALKIENDEKVVLDFDCAEENPHILSDSIFDFKFWLKHQRKQFIHIKSFDFPSSRRKRKEEINDEIEALNELINENKYNKLIAEEKYRNILLYDLEYEDELLGIVSSDIAKKFYEIQNQLIDDIFMIDENSFSSIDICLLLTHHAIEITNVEMGEYGSDDLISVRGNLNSFEYLFKIRFKTILLNFWLKLNEKIKSIHLSGNFKLKETEFYSHFVKFCSSLIDRLGCELSEFTNIEVLPVTKGLGSRYFQPDDFSLSFISKMAMKIDHSSEHRKIEWFLMWVDKWLGRFELGKSLKIKNIENRDIYTIEIIDFNDESRNIKDLGFGVSQIISLLLSPFNANFKHDESYSELKWELIVEKFEYDDKTPVFYLEEPESNLHPNWQSLLMELITEINQKFGIRFIIETHSEYMIRKLQFLMADKTKDLETDSALIYYFNSDKNVDESKGEPKIKKIKIDKNGGLSDNFGPGFYDEAINLKFDLLNLNKHQSN